MALSSHQIHQYPICQYPIFQYAVACCLPPVPSPLADPPAPGPPGGAPANGGGRCWVAGRGRAPPEGAAPPHVLLPARSNGTIETSVSDSRLMYHRVMSVTAFCTPNLRAPHRASFATAMGVHLHTSPTSPGVEHHLCIFLDVLSAMKRG